MPRGPVETDAEAAYLAGAALNALDVLVRADPPWLGAWRHRLALKAAAVTIKLLRRPEGEAALREAWVLRQPGDALGPADAILGAWRQPATRRPNVDAGQMAAIADLLGLRWDETLDTHQLSHASSEFGRSWRSGFSSAIDRGMGTASR